MAVQGPWRCGCCSPNPNINKTTITTINADNLILNELTIAKMLLDEDPATVRTPISMRKET